MSQHFNLYSQYYELLYLDKNYQSEVAYINDTIRQFGHNVQHLLEIGSGTGQHALLLKQLGYTIYGIELSPGMVQQAKDKGVECEAGDVCSFKLNKTFDGVLSLFHVISYLSSNEQLISAFKNIHQHLNAGGIFIFDFWYAPAVLHQGSDTRKKIVENDQIKVIRFAEPVQHVNDNIIDVHYQILVKDKKTHLIEEFTEKHPMRYFSLPELKILAELTGFTWVHSEEFLTAGSLNENTWGACVILKKK